MESNFFSKQDNDSQTNYINLLIMVGSLSNLFTDSKNPFLYYRAMENIFCKVFGANNLSRSDISVDASKDKLGIGLKTFLQNNGNTFQKIAEFNKDSSLLRNLMKEDLIKMVSKMRNERIEAAMRICNLSDVMYHIITRSRNKMSLFEEHMDFINIDNIQILKTNESVIHFKDDLNDYSFNLSKSTLLKKFNTTDKRKIRAFGVDILEDPYSFLLSFIQDQNSDHKFNNILNSDKNIVDYIVLPLYSPLKNEVSDKSGLNQWNARGRARNKDEVYIPIPSWIHEIKKGFFNYNTEDNKTEAFDVKLPNGKILSMRVAQQGGKALMSNPNSALGNWILREVLKIEPYTKVKKNQLDIIGIDSIKLSKIDDKTYYLDFLKSGSFEKFEKFIKK